MKNRIVSLAFVGVFAACPNQQETEPPKPEGEDSQLRALMNKQLEAADSIHYAIAFGELAKARASADWLSKNAMAGPAPQSWAAMVSAVQLRAEKTAGAKKLGDVGAGMGSVLAACGTCHDRLGLALVAQSRVKPSRAGGNKNMLGHTFAMTQLEHGLLLPSEALWDQGAAMIEAGSFDLAAFPLSALEAKESLAVVAELKALGADAIAATTLSEKGRLYGEMMSRCNSCHDLTRADEGDSK